MNLPGSMGRNPRVSCVIPCRNEVAHIESCLTAVLSQDMPDGGFEIIVADGMSDDGTREVLRRLIDYKTTGPQDDGTYIRIIDNPGKIVSTGLNAAVRSAQGDIIVRMDAHTEYGPDYVIRCVEALEKTGAENVGGPWVAKGDGFISRSVAAAFQSPFAVGGARGHDPNHEGPVDTVYLGCWRKEVFEKFGYFDEELVRNQDDEHNLRIIRGGGKVFQAPKIRSWYRPRSSLSALFKQYMQYGYWKVRVIQKHKLPASWRHLVPGAFVLALMLLLVFSVLCYLLSVLWPPSPGSLSSVLCPLPSVLLGLALSAYAFAVFAASVHTAARTEWKLLPVLPLVFPCYHFGYGYGFLRGIWDFVIHRKGAQASFEKLSR